MVITVRCQLSVCVTDIQLIFEMNNFVKIELRIVIHSCLVCTGLQSIYHTMLRNTYQYVCHRSICDFVHFFIYFIDVSIQASLKPCIKVCTHFSSHIKTDFALQFHIPLFSKASALCDESFPSVKILQGSLTHCVICGEECSRRSRAQYDFVEMQSRAVESCLLLSEKQQAGREGQS